MAGAEIDSSVLQPEPEALPQITTAEDETTYFPAPDGPEWNMRTFGLKAEVQVGAIKQHIPSVRKMPSVIDDNVLLKGKTAGSPGVTKQFRPGFADREKLNNSVRYQSNEGGLQLIEEPNPISKSAAEDQSSRIQDAFSPKNLKDDPLDILASKGWETNAIEAPTSFESPPLKRKHTETNGYPLMTIGLKDWSNQGIYLPGEDAHLKPSAVPIAREEMPEQSALVTGTEARGIKGSVDVEARQIDSDNGSTGRFPVRSLASDVSGVLGSVQRQQDSPSIPAPAMDKVASGESHGFVANATESSHSECNSDSFQPISDHLAKCTEKESGHLSSLQERSSEESVPLHLPEVDGRETAPSAQQIPQVSSPTKWNQGRDPHDKDSISTVSTQISEAVKSTKMKGSDLPARKDESDNTFKEDRSESLQLMKLLDSGVPREHQSESVKESIADLADSHRVSEPSNVSPSSSGEALLEENHTSNDHIFDTSSPSSKNKNVFQGVISDISAPGLHTLVDTLNKSIPQDTLVQPLEISGERVEQISSYRPEKDIVIDAQQDSVPSEEKMKGSLKQTGADQEDQRRDAGERSAMVLHTAPSDEFANSLKEREKSEVRDTFAGRKMAAVWEGQREGWEAMLRDTDSFQEPTAELSGIVEQGREDEIGLGETERVALNEAPEISGLPEKIPENFMLHFGMKTINKGAKAGESEVFDESGYPSLARSDPRPYKPGFQQSIIGETQPVAAIKRTLSDLSKGLSGGPGGDPVKGQRLPEKDNKQMAAESIPFDKALENSGIGETTKSAEAADKNQLSDALPIHNTARNHPPVQPKGDRPLEPLSPPEDNAQAERFTLPPAFLERTNREFWQSPLDADTDIRSRKYPELNDSKTDAILSPTVIPLPESRVETSVDVDPWQERDESPEAPFPGPASRDISDSRSSGNQNSSKRSSMSRREPAGQSEGEIQTSSRPESQSETSRQPFVSMVELVPEGAASKISSDYRESPFSTVSSPKQIAPKARLRKTPAVTPSSRSFPAQRSKMRRGQKEKKHQGVGLSSSSRQLGRTVVPSLISTTQSPVIQMTSAASEPVNKVKVTVRHIEVRSGEAEASREPLRASPKPTPALSLEEYLRLRGEGKL